MLKRQKKLLAGRRGGADDALQPTVNERQVTIPARSPTSGPAPAAPVSRPAVDADR